MGCSGSLGVGADTGNFRVRLETSKVIKNCLKSTLVAKISRIKVAKKGNLLSLPLALFHFSLPEASEVRPLRDEIASRDPCAALFGLFSIIDPDCFEFLHHL